jgi:hypothetical protein
MQKSFSDPCDHAICSCLSALPRVLHNDMAGGFARLLGQSEIRIVIVLELLDCLEDAQSGSRHLIQKWNADLAIFKDSDRQGQIHHAAFAVWVTVECDA